MTTSSEASPADEARQIRVSGQLSQLRERFGDRYDDEQWSAIERQLEATALKAEALRSVPLGNGDEPEIPFAPVLAARRSL
jgi:hypothetical protein